MVDTVVIEMCRRYSRIHLVCRMLYRCKCMYLLTDWKNNNSSRMLSRCTSYINTACCQTLYLTVTLGYVMSKLLTLFLKITFNISVSRFLSNRTYRTCLERLPLAEYNLSIGMCLTLVFVRKVKVDIRLLVTLEAKECFKRNVKSFLTQLFAAHRAYLIRHIASCRT